MLVRAPVAFNRCEVSSCVTTLSCTSNSAVWPCEFARRGWPEPVVSDLDDDHLRLQSVASRKHRAFRLLLVEFDSLLVNQAPPISCPAIECQRQRRCSPGSSTLSFSTRSLLLLLSLIVSVCACVMSVSIGGIHSCTHVRASQAPPSQGRTTRTLVKGNDAEPHQLHDHESHEDQRADISRRIHTRFHRLVRARICLERVA